MHSVGSAKVVLAVHLVGLEIHEPFRELSLNGVVPVAGHRRAIVIVIV